MKLIRFKRGKERIKGFSKPVEKAERAIDWAWILLVLAMVITMITEIGRAHV